MGDRSHPLQQRQRRRGAQDLVRGISDIEVAKAAVEASAVDPVGPLALTVKRSVRAQDLTAMGVVAGQVWKWRKSAVMGTQSMF